MLPENKELLQLKKTSITALLNTEHFPQVLQHLTQQQVISDTMRRDILCQWPQHEQIFLLMDIIETSDDEAFDIFHQILQQNGYNTAAAILKPNPVDLGEVPGVVDEDGVFTPRLIGYGHREITRYEATYRARAMSRARAEQQSQAANEERLKVEYEACMTGRDIGWGGWRHAQWLRYGYETDRCLIGEEEPVEWPTNERCEEDYPKYIQANTALSQHVIHKYQLSNKGKYSMVYKMSAPVRGYILIINNKNFTGIQDGDTRTRRGTEVDVAAISELFIQLNFEVDIHEDLTGQEMKDKLKTYSQMDHSSFDCFCCVISSYSTTAGPVGVDGSTISYNEIHEQFKAENCPSLENKPKLFLTQASLIDNGDQETEKLTAINDDCFISKSIIPDFLPSKFDTFYGTWFLFTWIYVIEKHAHNCHMTELAAKVGQLFDQFSQTSATSQPPPETSSTLRKKLYLFPGLYQGLTPR